MGDDVNFQYFILSGSVENYLMTERSSRKVLNTLHAGDDFSLPDLVISSFRNRKSECYSVCLEDTVVGLITKCDFMDHCITIPSINMAYIEMMSMIIHELCNELMLTDCRIKSCVIPLLPHGSGEARGRRRNSYPAKILNAEIC